MKMKFYSDDEVDEVATIFFKHYYQDRGIKKWGGFFLSEHRAALEKQREAERQANEKGVTRN